MRVILFTLLLSTIAFTQSKSFLPNLSPDGQDIQDLYEHYLLKNPNIQSTAERFQYFADSVKEIFQHNANPSKTFTMEINSLTGLFFEEMVGTYIMDTQNCSATTRSPNQVFEEAAPEQYFDWRDKGIITPVKNQGQCGSCWSFSTTGSLEGFWALYTKQPPTPLSEQQLLDCSVAYGNNGCSGGLPSQAFTYITDAGGLETELSYPYIAEQGSCKFNSTKIFAQVFSGSVNITEGDEQQMFDALPNVGPIAIAFQVVQDFRNYNGGVYTSTVCQSTTQSVNHAVLAVGYGYDSQSDLEYWIVKNSWGASWGVGGYFWIERGVNMCGVAECSSYPNMTKA